MLLVLSYTLLSRGLAAGQSWGQSSVLVRTGIMELKIYFALRDGAGGPDAQWHARQVTAPDQPHIHISGTGGSSLLPHPHCRIGLSSRRPRSSERRSQYSPFTEMRMFLGVLNCARTLYVSVASTSLHHRRAALKRHKRGWRDSFDSTIPRRTERWKRQQAVGAG